MPVHIAVDIDGVLAKFNEGFLDFFNATHKESFITMDDVVSYDMAKSYGVDEKTMVAAFRHFTQEEMWETLGTYSAWVKLVELLCDTGYRCTLLTARATNKHDNHLMRYAIRKQTLTWLDDHFDLAKFWGVHFERDKIGFCECRGYSFLIDDAPRYALKAAETKSKVKVITPYRNWNSEVPMRHSPEAAMRLLGLEYTMEPNDAVGHDMPKLEVHAAGLDDMSASTFSSNFQKTS